MNSLSSKIAIACTSLIIFSSLAKAWEVDMSRRQLEFNRVTNESRLPASAESDDTQSLFGQVFETVEPTQDIVILNTEKGFIPNTIRLKKGSNYRVHVVNVNQKEKNISFVLDAFSEHHSTVYGQERTFSLNPKVDGIFSYQCPETAVQGKVIVMSTSDGERKPASK